MEQGVRGEPHRGHPRADDPRRRRSEVHLMDLTPIPVPVTRVAEHEHRAAEVTMEVTFYVGDLSMIPRINDAIASMIGTVNIVPPVKTDPWAKPTSPVDQYDRR